MTPERAIVESAHALAINLPAATVEALAFALLTSSAGSLRFEIARRIAHHQHREMALRFIDHWQTHSSEVDARTASVALQTAALSEQAHRDSRSVELAWTGPDNDQIPVRRTEQAILQVLDSAKSRITLVSFAVYRIPNVASALVRAAKRGVQITVVIETPDRIKGQGEYSTLRALGPEVAACSTVYFWPEEQRPVGENEKPGILHVKCAVADGAWLFLSSANLTQQAFTVNMELGMLVRGGSMPGRVEEQFQHLVSSGVLKSI